VVGKNLCTQEFNVKLESPREFERLNRYLVISFERLNRYLVISFQE